MTALLPCPFCNAELEDRRISAFAHPKNGCILDGFAMTDPAIPKWNRRTPPPLPTRDEVAREIARGLGTDEPNGIVWANDSRGLNDVVLDGHFDLLDAADAVLRLLGANT